MRNFTNNRKKKKTASLSPSTDPVCLFPILLFLLPYQPAVQKPKKILHMLIRHQMSARATIACVHIFIQPSFQLPTKEEARPSNNDNGPSHLLLLPLIYHSRPPLHLSPPSAFPPTCSCLRLAHCTSCRRQQHSVRQFAQLGHEEILGVRLFHRHLTF